MNDGKVSANNGDIGGVVMNDGKVSANNGDIGGVVMNDGKVSANNGDIGGVMMNDGKVSANNGDIGGVMMNDGKVSANNGDIGGVVMNDGKVSANNGDIGGVVMNDGKVSANNGDIGGVVMNDGKVSANNGDIGGVVMNDGKVTAEKGDIGDIWLAEGNISNVKNITAERGTIGDVKLNDGKVTAEKGDIGDVWLSDGNISNVQNITAERGTIGDVKLVDGKVTAEKGDIGDVWLSEGNISNVQNIKAESGNIGDVKLADGKVTAQKADIGGVFIKNESIQAGNIKINENGSNEITGLSNTRWNDGTPVDEDRAATEGQLSTVQGYVDDLEKKTQHITHTATDNGHYTTIEDHTNFNSDGSIDAVDGQFRVTSDGGLMLKDEAGNETFRIYNGTGGMKAASGKFVVNGETGEVTAPKGNIGGVILETTDDGKSKVKADKADIGGVIIKDKGIEAGTVQINKGSATDNRVIDVNGNFAVYNDGAFKAAGENFVVKATGDVTANSYTAGNVQINTDGHNTITGLSNVEWSGNAGDIVADRAATEGQLMTVQNDVQHISHETVDGMHYTKVEDTQIWNDGRIVTTGTVEAADAEFYADSQELVTAGQLYAAGIIPGEAKATPDKVNSQDSIAIGKGSNADIKATAIGSATSANQYSVVVGHQATADGIESVAVGRGASASNKGTVALGMYAKAEAKNAVALGTNSVADRADTVSVGSKDNERQITNVKAGKEDTDAVNVAQLKGVQDKVGDADFSDTNYAKTADNVTDAVKYVDAQVKVNSDDLAAYKAAGIVAGNEVGQYSNSIALGTDATVVNGTNSIAVGAGSTADGAQATALGQNSNALGDGAVSLGANSEAVGDGAVSIGSNNSAEVAGSVAIGNGAHVYEDGTNSVALGQWSQASDDRVVSVGNDWLKRRITNVAAGTDPTDAVNVQQLTDRTANMVEWDENTDDTIHGVTLENGMITAAEGNFKVYGTGGIYAADGKFQVNGNTGDVSAEGNLKAADGKFFVNGENGSIKAADGDFRVSSKGDVTAAGSLTAADEKFKVYGASGGFMAADGKVEVNGYTGDIRTDGKVTANEIHAANDNFIVYESGVVKLNDGNLVIGTNGDLNSKGTITGNVLSTGGFVANADGNAEAKGTVTANTLSTGADGFIANSDGDFEARNAYIDGTLLVGEKFKVTPDGELIAANSAFKVGADGTITAANGNFVVTDDPNSGTDSILNIGEDAFRVNENGGFVAGNGNFKVFSTGGVVAAGGDFKINSETGAVTTTSVTGLTNTDWNTTHDYSDSTLAATEAQLQAVADEAGKHTQVTVNGGNTDGNLKVTSTDNDGQTTYDISLSDTVTVGNDKKGVTLNGDATNGDPAFSVVTQGLADGRTLSFDFSSAGAVFKETHAGAESSTTINGSKVTSQQYVVDENNQYQLSQTAINGGIVTVSSSEADEDRTTIKGADITVGSAVGGAAQTHITNNEITIGGDLTDPTRTALRITNTKNEDGTFNRTITGLTNTDWAGQADDFVSGRAATEDQLAKIQSQVDTNEAAIGALHGNGVDGQSLEKAVAVANQLDGANLSALNALSQIAPMNLNVPMMTNSVLSAPQEASKGMRDPDPNAWGNNVTTEDMSTINNNLTVTGDTHLKGDLEVDGKATFNNGVEITKGNLEMNNNKITGVANGDISETSKDAVNGSQLYGVQQDVEANAKNISTLGGAVNKLGNRIDEVGAGAAALAALHPLDFDPDNKWDFSAGYGNYRGESAVAFGAFYRPNEDTMFSVGGTVGNDDNMVNAGVSLKIGSGSSGVTTSRVAMAKEIKAMRDVVAKQDAQIQKLTAMVNALVGVKSEPDTTTMFPDVPENHWAYEAVATMARSGLVKGYPDGEFKGDRTMTRYEFAQIIQNAIQAGAEVDSRLVEEFKPELEYFHIATVAKDKDGNPTIERVRAN